MIYNVSYVVLGGDHPGQMQSQENCPRVGERMQLGDLLVEIVEVRELMPPMGDFAYLHVTCRPVQAEQETQG
ncbi:MAG: hypothetical protein J7M16_05635 [Anaerolineae bacterium]|nr:hypothetical protein [Anaerolineae bacterium]RLC62191.1 MAG: hypothetical protein DRI80_06955 [Chloroflexota bacterium]HIP96031.1 hypothetical protein [Anaerolineae bacterium]